MKNTFIIISTVLLFIGTLFLGSFFSFRLKKEKLNKQIVRVFPMDKHFIETDEVQKIMQVQDSLNEKNDVSYFEKKLMQNKYIAHADVYKDLNGKLIAEVTQFYPVARVMGDKSYYIDLEGDNRPLSKHYTENVVLIYGDVNKENEQNILDLVKKINDDELLSKAVSEVHINRDAYRLVLKDVSSVFTMNSLDQLFKLKVMYAYLKKNALNNKYQKVDLRYSKQAVCK